MAAVELSLKDVLTPGVNVQAAFEADLVKHALTGTIVSSGDGQFTVRLNERPRRSPWPGDILAIGTQLEETFVEFEVAVQRCAPGPVPELVFPWPRKVRTRSLRRHPRVALKADASYRFYATCTPDPRPVQSGTVLDVSRGGLALEASDVPEGESMLRLDFQVPSQLQVTAECVQRHCVADPDGGKTYTLGLEFVMISPQERKAIDLFVSSTLASG